MPIEMSLQGIDKNLEAGLAMQAACLPEGKYPFDPAVSLVAFRTLAAFTPKHPVPDDALPEIIGRIYAFLHEENEKRIHFFLKTTDKRPRFAFTVSVQSDEPAKPCKKGSPFPLGGRCLGHPDQSLEFLSHPFPAGGNLWIGALRKTFGSSDEMTQAVLPQVDPFAVNPVVVTDEYPRPGADQFLKGLPGSVRMDHKEGGYGTGHYPKPIEFPAVVPRRLVDVIHFPSGPCPQWLHNVA